MGFQGASSSSGATVANSFNVVGGSWDGSSELVTFWTDATGTSGSASATGANMQPEDHLYIRIGGGSTSPGNDAPALFFEGDIAEILIYNRLLSQAEIDSVSNYLYNTHVIPEPSTYALFAGLFLLGWVFIRRKRS